MALLREPADRGTLSGTDGNICGAADDCPSTKCLSRQELRDISHGALLLSLDHWMNRPCPVDGLTRGDALFLDQHSRPNPVQPFPIERIEGGDLTRRVQNHED